MIWDLGVGGKSNLATILELYELINYLPKIVAYVYSKGQNQLSQKCQFKTNMHSFFLNILIFSFI